MAEFRTSTVAVRARTPLWLLELVVANHHIRVCSRTFVQVDPEFLVRPRADALGDLFPSAHRLRLARRRTPGVTARIPPLRGGWGSRPTVPGSAPTCTLHPGASTLIRRSVIVGRYWRASQMRSALGPLAPYGSRTIAGVVVEAVTSARSWALHQPNMKSTELTQARLANGRRTMPRLSHCKTLLGAARALLFVSRASIPRTCARKLATGESRVPLRWLPACLSTLVHTGGSGSKWLRILILQLSGSRDPRRSWSRRTERRARPSGSKGTLVTRPPSRRRSGL